MINYRVDRKMGNNYSSFCFPVQLSLNLIQYFYVEKNTKGVIRIFDFFFLSPCLLSPSNLKLVTRERDKKKLLTAKFFILI